MKTASAVPSSTVIDPSEILTLEQVASRLQVKPRYIYEKTRSRCLNPIPAIKLGRYTRFVWSDVSKWLEAQKVSR